MKGVIKFRLIAFVLAIAGMVGLIAWTAFSSWNRTGELREKLTAAKLPENVMKEATRELNRLEAIPSASPEYGVIRTWLQIVSELPWAIASEDKLDLIEARKILDRDHHSWIL